MIKIEERECEKLSGITSLFLSFPFNQEAINIIKSYDKYVYDKKTYTWEVPVNALSYLLDNLTYIDDITLKLMKDDSSKIHYVPKLTYKTKPFQHQLEGIEYGLNNDNWLLLDECGLGKSKTLINLVEELKYQKDIEHCLVICAVNSLKENWLNEIYKHSNLTGTILGKKTSSKGTISYGSVNDRIEQLKNKIDEFFIIVNVETIRNEDFVEVFNKQKVNKIDMIIVDEIHKVSNITSKQGKNLCKLKSNYKVGATGTLITNSPLSCYGPLYWIGAEKCSLFLFEKFYCVYNNKIIVGYKNLQALQKHIETYSLRRTKDLLDLPEKTIINETIDLDDIQRKFYNDIVKGVKDEVDKIELNTSSILALSTRLRQAVTCPSVLTSSISTSSKIERCCDIVEQVVSNNNKVVIFSTFIETLNILKEKLSQYKPIMTTGDTKVDELSSYNKMFQEDNEHFIWLSTIKKSGTGLTLNRANYAIFVDSSWTPSDNSQAEDRVHRIGSSKNTFIYYLWGNNTIDEHIKEIVNDKSDLNDYLVDNVLSNNLANKLQQFLKNL